MIHTHLWKQITYHFGTQEFNHWLPKIVDTLVKQWTASLLVRPATLAYNFLSPQIQATHAAITRLNRSVLYLASLDPAHRARATVEARAAFETLQGLLTRRFTNWEGISAGLRGGERKVGRVLGPDAKKGVLELALEGKFGKAVKIATDQRARIGGVIPREVFDGANMYSAMLDNDGGALSDLAKLRVPTAFLKMMRFTEVDKVVKQNLVYAYKAHAVAAARAAGIRWGDRAARRAFVRDFMVNIARDHPKLHEEALALANLFGFEYANTPDIVSAETGPAWKKLLVRATMPFSGFITSMVTRPEASSATSSASVSAATRPNSTASATPPPDSARTAGGRRPNTAPSSTPSSPASPANPPPAP